MMESNNTLRAAMRYIAGAVRALKYGECAPERPSDISWNQVFALAKAHSLASTIWYILEPTVRAELKENEELRSLCDRWEGQRGIDYAKNLVQTAEFSALTQLFSENEIKFLPMKGFIFKRLWARPEHRTMADMDFCVREGDMQRTADLLIARGYHPEMEDGVVHDTFDKPPYLHVEIHKSLFIGSKDSFDSWIPREDNPCWYEMLPHDLLTFNVGHIYKHFVGGGCGARSLFDIYLYLEECGGEIDRDALEAALREKELSDFYKKLLHLVYFWYGDGSFPFEPDPRFIKGGKPTDELLEMEYFIITGGSYGSEENRVRYALSKKSRLAYALELAFPKYYVMKAHYPVLKYCPILLPLLYPVRWISYLFNGKVKRFFGYFFGKGKTKK